jgi:hypothetical protein
VYGRHQGSCGVAVYGYVLGCACGLSAALQGIEPKPQRACIHCNRTAEELGPIGMWQHCPEHEGGSLQHDIQGTEPKTEPSLKVRLVAGTGDEAQDEETADFTPEDPS